jgi:hypothetical protein
LGSASGTAPAEMAWANAAGTSRVRNASSTPAGRPVSGRT